MRAVKTLGIGLPVLTLTLSSIPAHAALTLMEKDGWKASLSGFVETDLFTDSTRSFTEVIGNSPAPRPDNTSSQNGRTQFSVRNSRFAFTLEPPQVDTWKTKGHLEFDLLGYDPAPPATSEGGFLTNPTLRVRHAYLTGESEGWQALMGQSWSLLGWQPYYFLNSVAVAPLPGMLYSRTPQLRGLKTAQLSESTTLQAALTMTRPPQRDATLPGFQGGLRLAFPGRSSGFTLGATGDEKPQPMSIAVSGDARQFVTPRNAASTGGEVVHHPAGSFSFDTLIPVLASTDGKDVSNTLTLAGEFSLGTGYGDEFSGWTGNSANPLNGSAAAPSKNVNLDAGIGDFDSTGAFQLVNLRTFNTQLQYHLSAESRTWFNAGYGQLYSSNIGSLTNANGITSAGGTTRPYDREEVLFGNIFHDLTQQIRMAFEYSYIRTRYTDGVFGHNNRLQLTAWFRF